MSDRLKPVQQESPMYPIGSPLAEEIRLRTGKHTGLEDDAPEVIELTFRTGVSGTIVVLTREAAQVLFEHLEETLYG